MNTHYHMTIAGCERDLPICPLNDKLSIGAFVIFGDCELTEACATELLKKAPEFDYLITAESKGIPLVYEMARQCGCKELPAGVEIVNATEVVEICDDPATAFKRKKDSSLTVGLTMLHGGEADGFVSAGSTGALLAGATLLVKRIRGLRRAALAPTIPTAKGKAVLIDCGANAECTVEYLLQFAYLGSYYASKVLR